MSPKELEIVDYDDAWPRSFDEVRRQLLSAVGSHSLAIDHVGSTSVPRPRREGRDRYPDHRRRSLDLRRLARRAPPGLIRHPTNDRDHVPAGAGQDEAQWAKRMWSQPQKLHVHVRQAGRLNQRYALLFRDFLRTDRRAAAAYAALKRSLAERAPDDWQTYYAVKDPACDLILAGAEHWARQTGWRSATSSR